MQEKLEKIVVIHDHAFFPLHNISTLERGTQCWKKGLRTITFLL